MQNKPYFFLSQTWGTQTGRRGGVPDLGKIPTFSRFFSDTVPYFSLSFSKAAHVNVVFDILEPQALKNI